MENTYKSRMAHRIKSTRHARGLTQEEVSRRSKDYGDHISASRLQMWEIGHRAPKMDILPILARVLHTTPAYLACYSDSQTDESESWRYIVPSGYDNKTRAIGHDAFAINVDTAREKGLDERNILAIKVQDNSVTAFKPGDVVFVDMSKKQFNKAAMFAIMGANNQVFFRHIRPEINGNYSMFCGDNSSSSDKELSANELEKLDVIGQMIGHFTLTI